MPTPTIDRSVDAALRARCGPIAMILSDVDGILTPGTLLLLPTGEAVKAFSARDGFGVRLARAAGLAVGWLTGRSDEATRARARELDISPYVEASDKAAAFEALLGELGLVPEAIAYLGDDLADVGVLRRVGLAVTVADAAGPCLEAAHYVARAPAGRGVLREVVELVLAAQGTLAAAEAELIGGR